MSSVFLVPFGYFLGRLAIVSQWDFNPEFPTYRLVGTLSKNNTQHANHL